MAKDVFPIIASFIRQSTHTTISINSNFHELGVNASNFVFVVTQLRDKGYFIGINDFIAANCLGDVLNQIFQNSLKRIEEEDLTQYRSIPLSIHHKHQTIA